ncbi:hypothetical protein [Photobacterium swingsii]|nr:hypothetical protein [Photobacterium swingsii]
MEAYLQATPYFDYQNPLIEQLSRQVSGANDREKAVSIYYLVRDGIKYNPYTLKDGLGSLKASYCLEHHQAFCIPKSA